MKRRVSTHFIITYALWAGLAMSLTMMQLAFNRRDRDATDLYGICSGALCCAAALSSFLLASRSIARRELEKSRARAQIRSGAQDLPYIAMHSTGAKIVALSLVLALGLLIGFFFYHPHSGSTWMWCALGPLFCTNSVYVYRLWMTTISFENNRISIRISPFVDFSEPYSNITSIRAKQGVLELHFKDGRKMSRWSGLGDPDKIAEILMQKTDVLPT